MSEANYIDKQLALPLQLRDDATLENFYPGKNQILLTYLQNFISQIIKEFAIYLWGNAGVGHSHLLQAACHKIREQQQTAIYLPLAKLNSYTPEALENLEKYHLICLDNLELIAGKKSWEEAIFHLYNRTQSQGNRLLIAANNIPLQLNLQLPDLTSRLTNSVIFHVEELDDNEKLAALKLRAQLRGLELNNETAQFLLHRAPRDSNSLFNLLEKLDLASLAEQRRLTIPFVKLVLGI